MNPNERQAAVAGATGSEDWRPIETAPMDGTWVLLFAPDTPNQVYTGCWDDQINGEWNHNADRFEWIGAWTNLHVESFEAEELVKLNPTHWMPLPKSPNVQAHPPEDKR